MLAAFVTTVLTAHPHDVLCIHSVLQFSHVLFCSLAVLDPIIGHTMNVLFPLPLSSAILIDSSMVSPVHVLMLSIQAVRGLPRVHVPGIVPCFISYGNSLVSSWCDHSMLASLLWQSLIFPALLQLCWGPIHLFSLLSTKLAVSSSALLFQRC